MVRFFLTTFFFLVLYDRPRLQRGWVKTAFVTLIYLTILIILILVCMSGDRYKINDQYAAYFCTLTIVKWIDVFTRQVYRDIVVESLNYCVENKGLTIYSWVLMSNHLHLIVQVKPPLGCSGFLRDFKKFTSKSIVREIKDCSESRKEWLLDKFSFEARRTSRAENYKIWQDSNHAIEMDGQIDIWQKIDYIHNNPVRNGLVEAPEHYCYSSARDYMGVKGLVRVDVL